MILLLLAGGHRRISDMFLWVNYILEFFDHLLEISFTQSEEIHFEYFSSKSQILIF